MASLITQLTEMIDACEKVWTYNLEQLTIGQENLTSIINIAITSKDNLQDSIEKLDSISTVNIDEELFPMPSSRLSDIWQVLLEMHQLHVSESKFAEFYDRVDALREKLNHSITENISKLKEVRDQLNARFDTLQLDTNDRMQFNCSVILQKCNEQLINYHTSYVMLMAEIMEYYIPFNPKEV